MGSQLNLLLSVLLLAAAPGCVGVPDATPDGSTERDAGAVDAGGLDAGAPDGGAADAGGADGGADAGPITATVFPRVGATADSVFTPAGPGLVLVGGGTDVDSAFVWMRSTLSTSTTSRQGDVVVLRATGTNAYDQYIFDLAPFNSVQTVLLPPPSTAADLSLAASVVDRAEAVFFAGGDQSHYAAWVSSPLLAAVQRVYERGGVVGGTSAGLAILGQFAYDARVGSVTSVEALANPYSPLLTFTSNGLSFPPLAGVITDTHFGARDRFGRLTAFMARQIADGAVSGSTPTILGLGVDQATAVVVESNGRATLLRQPPSTGSAYFALGGPASQVRSGLPLIYPGIQVTRLDAAAQYYDFARRCGTGPTYRVSVNASQTDPFGGVNPYSASGPAGNCP